LSSSLSPSSASSPWSSSLRNGSNRTLTTGEAAGVPLRQNLASPSRPWRPLCLPPDRAAAPAPVRRSPNR
jgi:hypothetical protein